jgi:hypothetical protein
VARVRLGNPQTWRQAGLASDPFTLYCIAEEGCELTGPCKVGIATHMGTRMSSLQCGNWRPLILVWQVLVGSRDDAIAVEGLLLSRFRPCIFRADPRPRLKSEWVQAAPMAVLETAVQYVNALLEAPVEKVA